MLHKRNDGYKCIKKRLARNYFSDILSVTAVSEKYLKCLSVQSVITNEV